MAGETQTCHVCGKPNPGAEDHWCNRSQADLDAVHARIAADAETIWQLKQIKNAQAMDLDARKVLIKQAESERDTYKAEAEALRKKVNAIAAEGVGLRESVARLEVLLGKKQVALESALSDLAALRAKVELRSMDASHPKEENE